MNKIYDYSTYKKRYITGITGFRYKKFNISYIGYTKRLFTVNISNNSTKKPKISKYISTGVYTKDDGRYRYRPMKLCILNIGNHGNEAMSDYSDI